MSQQIGSQLPSYLPEVTMKTVRPKKSGVWRYFDVDTEDDSKAVCKMCPNLFISRGSKTKGPQSYGTSALWAHLKLSHKDIYVTLDKCPSYPAKTPKKPKLPRKSQTLVPNTSKIQIEEVAGEVLECHNQLFQIGEMIALDNHSVSVVDEEGFRRLVGSLLPSLVGLTPGVMGERILPQIYARTRAKIEQALVEAEWLSVCLEVDQTMFDGEILLLVSARWVSREYEVREVVLGEGIFPNYPSPKIVDSLYEETLAAWGIPRGKVHVVSHGVADKAVRGIPVVTEVPNESFFAAFVQMTIGDSLLQQNAVSRVLDLCRNFVCYSTEARETLDIMHLLHTVPFPNRSPPSSPPDLALDSASDWRTTHAMLATMRLYREAIDGIISLNQALRITDADWAIVDDVLGVFSPLVEVTSVTEPSHHNFASRFIPLAAVLMQYFNKTSSTQVQQTLKEGFERTFYHEYKIEERKPLLLATLLDPRFKLAYISEDQRTLAKEWLVEEVQRHGSSEQDPIGRPIPQIQLDIWECFSEIATGNKQKMDTTDSCPNPEETREVERYLASPLLSRDQNPLLWWKSHASYFPTLSTMARQYLSATFEGFFRRNKNDKLLLRLRKQVEDDLALSNQCLDFNQRLFLHLNLRSLKCT